MKKQTLTPEEFSSKLAEELVKAGKVAPKDVLILDQEGSDTDPIGWMMRNVMRMELARLNFVRSIYHSFMENRDKRQTADLIISSSRVMAASLLKDYLMKSVGETPDIDRFAFVIGVDPEVLKRDLLDASASASGVILP